MRVARWYCPASGTTFSLLPDCLASRLMGSLDQVEEAVVAAESLGVAAAVRDLRGEQVELPGAQRWLARRRRGVRAALLALLTVMPGQLGTVAELSSVRASLCTERALVALRAVAAERLWALPAPLGLRPRRLAVRQRDQGVQHETGPDPPAS